MEPTTPRRPRRWLPLALGGVLVLAVGGGAAALMTSTPPPTSAPTSATPTADTGDDDEVSSEPLAAAPTAQASALSEDEHAEVERGEQAVKAVVSALDEIGRRADGSAVGADAVATDWALGELQARAREQHDLGYRQTGEAVITSITATDVDLAASPATMTLKVCVDTSDIDVLDAAGNSLAASLYRPGGPVAHLYGAVFDDGVWKVATHDIPDLQDCPAR